MSPIFSARLEMPINGQIRDVLFLFWSNHEFDAVAISSEIQTSINKDLQPDEVLILVRQSTFSDASNALRDSPFITQLLDRLSNQCLISLVAFSTDGSEADRYTIPRGEQRSDIDIGSIARPGVTEIFRNRNGFIESTSNFHFRNPSMKHTDRFIRLSNILSVQAEISFIAFCLLPFIHDHHKVAYLDTPSLYPIVSSLNDHLRHLDPDRRPIVADNFGSYKGAETYDFSAKEESIVLISASSSGSLEDKLVHQYGFSRDQILHVLYLGKARDDIRVVVDLRYSKVQNPRGVETLPGDFREGSCALCESGSFAIPLFGDQFDLPGPQLEPLVPSATDAPEGLAAQFGKFAGQAIFGVGLDKKDSENPRQFNIDVGHLLENREFSSELDYVLRRTTPLKTKYIIFLDKRSRLIAEAIGDQLAEVCGESVTILRRDQVDLIPDGIETPVIVVAAVIESGRGLLDISRDLRTRCRVTALVYIVGLEKTTARTRREALRGNLTKTSAVAPHELVSIERLILPASADDHSWAKELQLYRRMTLAAPIPARVRTFIENRISRLSKYDSPLVDELFLGNKPNDILKVRHGFVFADKNKIDAYSQADIYFTISSLLQRLRANADRLGAPRALRSNWFQQTTLAPETFGRFNDGVIQASFLRAATASELNYAAETELSKEMARIAIRIVRSAQSSRGEAAAEFLLALATHQMTLQPEHTRTILEAVPSSMALLMFLKRACQKELNPDVTLSTVPIPPPSAAPR